MRTTNQDTADWVTGLIVLMVLALAVVLAWWSSRSRR